MFIMNEEIAKQLQELLALNKELANRVLSHQCILAALLCSIDKTTLRRVKKNLGILVENGKFQEVNTDALNIVNQTASIISESDKPVDQNKILHLIKGGSEE